MATIVITEFMDEPAVARLAKHHAVTYDATLVDDLARLRTLLRAADAVIVRNRTEVNQALLAAAPQLRVVGRLGVGLDNIDLGACGRRNIPVIPATGANVDAVAEYVIGALLALRRPAFLNAQAVLAGDWPRQTSIGGELQGDTLGIVGFGAIGQAVARRAAGLGMELMAYDPQVPPEAAVWSQLGVQPQPFDALLAQAGAITLHVPLLDSTRHLIDAAAIEKMQNRALIINTARGGVIDEMALATALREERIAGAALDVFENEPLPADSCLVGVPNLIATPHIAGLTDEANTRVSDMIADAILTALAD